MQVIAAECLLERLFGKEMFPQYGIAEGWR
jgi:hypothetical protein